MAIVCGAIAHFQLDFPSKADFKAFAQNSVKRQIFRLKEEGLVEALHSMEGKWTVGIWRWKTGLPTIADLAGLVSD